MDGNCSNTAETEQIFVVQPKNSSEIKIYSYIQTRGSMPFLWQQKPSLKWEPKGNVHMPEKNKDVCRKHMDIMLRDDNKKVTLINLIDKKRTQKMLGDEFERTVNSLNVRMELRILV